MHYRYKWCKVVTVFIHHLPLFLVAVQNERQPRNRAQVSPDSICMGTRGEHLATTRELSNSASYRSVICRPMVMSSVASCANTQARSNSNNSHRLMVGLLTAETCAKLEPENGETTGKTIWLRLRPNKYLEWAQILLCYYHQWWLGSDFKDEV